MSLFGTGLREYEANEENRINALDKLRFIEYKYRRISDSFGQVMRFSGIRKTYLRHKKNDMLNIYIHSVI